MKILPLLALLWLLPGCGQKLSVPEGIYTMCAEVAGYSGESIELKDGQFRYWFYTDVRGGNELPYPLTGTYAVAGNQLTLQHASIRNPRRTFEVINGVTVLWRDDGLSLWKSERKVHPFAVLLRVEGLTGEPSSNERPSIGLLKSAELASQEEKAFTERYNDLPPESRRLFRARTARTDPDLAEYQAEVSRTRMELGPKLVAQLVALIGRDAPHSIEGRMVLKDLYTGEGLIRTPPPFLIEEHQRKRALESLIDALSSARDRTAVEETIMLFLQVSGIGKLHLAVPETPLTIKLEVMPSGAAHYGSEGTTGDDIDWLKSLSKVIPACQKWMKSQLHK